MSEYIIRRQFNSLLTTGIAATIICFIFTLVYWPIWGLLVKALGTFLASEGLKSVDTKVAAKYFTVLAEGTFFWTIINAWIWQTLVFGNYGKTYITDRQPWAGIWYTFISFIIGIIGFLLLAGFIGIWWKPFNLAILLTPVNAEEVLMAIEGWETSNFYALAVIVAQIPAVALFHKWPFAGNSKAPWDSLGVMMFSSVAALLFWIATIVPSLMKLSAGGHVITSQPMGSWPTYLAFCQSFIFWFLIPAEGGEHYPMKAFAKKQPYMGLVGLAIALFGGFLTPAILRPIVGTLNLLPGAPVDLVIASLVLSAIVAMLIWHHLFDDYPTAQMVPNQTTCILTRVAIWIILGGFLGVVWIKTFKMLPFGGNDLGMGYPTMGLLAGQFAILMVFVYFNTFFDKWPLVRKEAFDKVQVQDTSRTAN